MKKLLSCLLAVAMLLSLMTFTAVAAEMPTTIEAPGSIVLSETVLNGPCLQVTFNKGADLSELISLGTAAREQYGVENINYYIQIDWSQRVCKRQRLHCKEHGVVYGEHYGSVDHNLTTT